MNKLDCDCLHDTQHLFHKYQGMDQHTFDSNKPCPMDILSWQRIPVYNQADFQYKWANKNKPLAHLFRDIDYWVHREMVDMDFYIQ